MPGSPALPTLIEDTTGMETPLATSRILVVDDEKPIRDAIGIRLEQAGYDVEVCENGRSAIARLKQVDFALVVCDILMPENNGIEVICFLRQHQPSVKVIAISGYHDPLYLQSARGLGAARIFTKPLVLDDIANAVDSLLSTEVQE